ncbi:hypothetical protein GALMADRAFT_248448 [Galerina marginata CBS 339.88]|uniref:Uncharacterized protein n=1 Tax=Galerina marginata (strain CBS 339.88) TaxID=685588 RepID=A0A067T756_GALM3|nr:hypothetical protein GALMADRAFT_248448 [Galerina marginata CBS 339.88]
MPQQPETAVRARLCKIDDSYEGKKVRVAGRVLTYDVATGLATVIDGKHGLLVNMFLSLDSQSRLWATERLSTIIAIGHLERADVSKIWCPIN